MHAPKFLLFVFSLLLLYNCSTTQNTTASTAETSTAQPEKAVQGGMWIPNEVDARDMNKMGLELDINKLFNSHSTGLNQAIAHFNGGCTSELISPKGLLLTNHHCGYGEIQSHSTPENDYLKNGFWAYAPNQELVNENTTATFVLDIQEVTESVNNGIYAGMNEDEKLQTQQQNIQGIMKNTPTDEFHNVVVKPYFDGNKFYKILTETFYDVRLVGAPPSSIGKFGSDTDNWMWPRHTGDFSLFRIYADAQNKPAKYSPNNQPYIPKEYLKVSLQGIDQGDFTMVYGFPGRTQEYLPAIAVQNITQVQNPTAIDIRKIALDILDSKMRVDNNTRIKYASKYARISNYYKKWIGENLGIQKTGAIAKKLQYEKEYQAELNKNASLLESDQNILPQLIALHKQQTPYLQPATMFQEIFLRNSETFLMAYVANQLLDAYETPNWNRAKSRAISIIGSRYKDYEAELDQEVSAALLQYYFTHLPKDYLPQGFSAASFSVDSAWKNSVITGSQSVNGAYFNQNIEQAFRDDTQIVKALQNDPIVQFVKQMNQNYLEKTDAPNEILEKKINQLQEQYMASQIKVFKDKIFYPDANSTLRVTYGKVEPYTNGEGVQYPYQTYLSGVMEKYIPGDYEFDVSPKLQELYQQKDYGIYGENGQMPVNFIATNHTTGGNSGSPALDGNGNLIGLNFDRVWEGTMSDLYYDPSICRNIMVDARYILFIIDKYANAQNLISEIETIK